MAKRGVAKLFRNGRSQAVRLPREFRFEGHEVRIRVVPEGILLEPLISDTREWFAELDRLNTEPFMTPPKRSRNQSATLRRRVVRERILLEPLNSDTREWFTEVECLCTE